jgi:hypothetical protein
MFGDAGPANHAVMNNARGHPRICQWCAKTIVAVAVALGSGCASQPVAQTPQMVSAALSPVPEPVASRDAWRLAETYASQNKDCEVLVGSGDSMLPLYTDRTVLVVRHTPMSALRCGMTVAFINDRGWLVAHALVQKMPRGWLVKGVGNHEPDRTLVRRDNIIGVVVKAYVPTAGATNVTQLPAAAVSVASAAESPRLQSGPGAAALPVSAAMLQ